MEEYGRGREGDVANDLGNGGKGERKGKRVRTRADREYGEDMAIEGKVITPELRRRLTAAHHDHATAGHPGIQRMTSLVSRRYWWPGLREFVRNYIKGCATCQATKAGTTKPRVPLFPIMARHALISFGVIALDLIVDLPPSDGYDSILTITDHDCAKASLFFPCRQTITSQGVACHRSKGRWLEVSNLKNTCAGLSV